MATEQRNLFNPKIEALSEKYTDAMGKLAATPFTGAQISAMAPKVAPQTALQQQATTLTGSGIGSYQPFVTAAQQAAGTAGNWFRFSTNWIRCCRSRINWSRNNIRNCWHTINRSTTSSWYSRNNYCRSRTIYKCSRNRIRSSRNYTWWSISIYWCSRNRSWCSFSFNWYRCRNRSRIIIFLHVTVPTTSY
jgi:hypothetical protein